MVEKTINDILLTNIDSNETKFYNLSAANTLTVGPNNEVSINASQSTIPGTLNTSASYALYSLTASYAINGGSGGGGGSTDTGSLLKTASFSNPNISFTKGDGTTFNVNISTLSVTSASYALTSSQALTASFINGGTF